MDKKEVIAARLAEWGLTMSESELAQLVPAYDNLMRWQTVLEDMLQTNPRGPSAVDCVSLKSLRTLTVSTSGEVFLRTTSRERGSFEYINPSG